VIALAVIRHPDGDRILVHAPDEEDFHRLLGGHVELGEHSSDTIARELREELGIEVIVGDLRQVIQNRFEWRGQAGHDVDFIHDARFADETLYDRDVFLRLDRPTRAVWRSLSNPPPVRLVPEGLELG
jgi:ADP-ribose pyrophosphatase YjhB (NUDIX family)